MSTSMWTSSSANISALPAMAINTTVTIPSVQPGSVITTNAAPPFVSGFQTVPNSGPWQNSQPNGGWGQWQGSYGDPPSGWGNVEGGTAIGGIPYNLPVTAPNNPGDVLTSDGSGAYHWIPAPVSPTALELIQQLIAQGLMEIAEDGTLRMVPAFPAPRAESKPATKIPFVYVDEEELYLEIERCD